MPVVALEAEPRIFSWLAIFEPMRQVFVGSRAMLYFDGRAWSASVHRREELAAGRRLRGPAVICEYSATTVVPPGWRLTVDALGGLVLEDRDA